MAAKDHLQGEQLRMFMRPHEIKDMIGSSEDMFYLHNPELTDEEQKQQETMPNLWAFKRHHWGPWERLQKDVEKEGVKTPIEVGTPWRSSPRFNTYRMKEGHHRVIAAEMAEEATNKEYYVPITYR